jgi:LmbE family N-acetylglucosaminyl deacetylase
MTPDKLAPIRQTEQKAAASVAGVKDVFFLGYEDGELAYTRQLLGDVVRYIRQIRPDAVFTSDPESIIIRDSFINHSDHRCAGLVTIDAVYPAARDRWNFPEHIEQGLQPHKVKDLYIWSFDKANFSVDITEVIDIKIQALAQHKSQFGDNPDFLRYIRERWRDEDGRHLEQFRRVVLAR